jgi:hypothetical protein
MSAAQYRQPRRVAPGIPSLALGGAKWTPCALTAPGRWRK